MLNESCCISVVFWVVGLVSVIWLVRHVRWAKRLVTGVWKDCAIKSGLTHQCLRNDCKKFAIVEWAEQTWSGMDGLQIFKETPFHLVTSKTWHVKWPLIILNPFNNYCTGWNIKNIPKDKCSTMLVVRAIDRYSCIDVRRTFSIYWISVEESLKGSYFKMGDLFHCWNIKTVSLSKYLFGLWVMLG